MVPTHHNAETLDKAAIDFDEGVSAMRGLNKSNREVRMSIIKEFKEFAVKGNAVDLAVGVVVGAAFGKIVTVLVDKIITPPIGLIVGNTDFSDLKIVLQEATADGAAEVALGYGELLQALLNFLIVAWALFLVIKAMNFLKRTEAQAPAEPAPEPADITLLREIRDTLKSQKSV